MIEINIKNKPVICIMGPTASGKTDLAIALFDWLASQHITVDLISVDSALVYRGMDIGTAKPEPELLANYPHALINIREPNAAYSAAEFCADASKLIDKAHAEDHLPILVGGTMLYFHCLQHGMADLPAANEKLRVQITAEADVVGWDAMHNKLSQLDSDAAARIHPNDPQRIQRALEVNLASGKTMDEFWQQAIANQQSLINKYKFINMALVPENRAILHQRIAKRFQQMLDNNFVDEVESLYKNTDLKLNLDMPAMRTVGYRQVWQYLAGEYDYATMQQKSIAATRQLAKRQLTWLNKWQDAELKKLYMENEDLIEYVKNYLESKL